MTTSYFKKSEDKPKPTVKTTTAGGGSATLPASQKSAGVIGAKTTSTLKSAGTLKTAGALKTAQAAKPSLTDTASKFAAIKQALTSMSADSKSAPAPSKAASAAAQPLTAPIKPLTPSTQPVATSVKPAAAPLQPAAGTALKADVSDRIKSTRETLAAIKKRTEGSAAAKHHHHHHKAVKPVEKVTDMQFRRFAAFIQEKSGIVLSDGKQYLVNSRLANLVTRFHCTDIDDLINQAMEEKPHNPIQDAVVDAMTTNETLWFRDTYPYKALTDIILPELAAKNRYPVRIWSAACSSGQEPYSIAMIIQEQVTHMVHVDPSKTQIIGTDLSPQMLEQCRKGEYDVHALSRGLSHDRRSKFFKPSRTKPGMMMVDEKLKSMIEFRPLNLLGSFALMGRYDVIFCRNVLIYFANDVKADILRKLTYCMNPGAYLILGSSESLTGVADRFEMVRCNPGIIYKLKPIKYGI